MTHVDRLDLLAQEWGFVLKSEQREALELLLRGKDVFCVLPTGFDKKPYLSDFCSCKEFLHRRHCYLACVKKADR